MVHIVDMIILFFWKLSKFELPSKGTNTKKLLSSKALVALLYIFIHTHVFVVWLDARKERTVRFQWGLMETSIQSHWPHLPRWSRCSSPRGDLELEPWEGFWMFGVVKIVCVFSKVSEGFWKDKTSPNWGVHTDTEKTHWKTLTYMGPESKRWKPKSALRKRMDSGISNDRTESDFL